MRTLGRWILLAGLVASVFGAGRADAASVLVATIAPPVPGADRVNGVLDDLNAGGKHFIAGVDLVAKFEVSGTTLTPETGSASSFKFTTAPSSGEIKSGSFAYAGDRQIVYYTLKAGKDTQLFGFFDDKGNQIALSAGQVVSFATEKGLSNAAFYGRPIPEPTSVLLLLAGGALVGAASRRSRVLLPRG